MPAPAVIPALKVYINTVVVKTPVVYQRVMTVGLTCPVRYNPAAYCGWLGE